MGRVTVVGGKVGMEAPVNYPANLADATWEQVIEACQKNKVPDTWNVGDSKSMTFLGGTDYQIDIIGKNHDTYSDGSGKAPLTFQLHDCYESAYEMNSGTTNNGGWEGCKMRSTRLPFILESIMPTEVSGAIKEVNKLTSAGSQSSTIVTTADKLFLLSEIEITGSINNSFSGEGSQYDYYKAGNSKVKNQNGSAGDWWLRSPYARGNLHFCYVIKSGVSDATHANGSFGVAFAFCF